MVKLKIIKMFGGIMPDWAMYIFLPLLFAIGGAGGFLLARYIGRLNLNSAENKAKEMLNEVERQIEARKKEALVEQREIIHKEKMEFEREIKERRQDLQRQEKRLLQKDENLERKIENTERRDRQLQQRERNIENKEKEIAREIEKLKHEQEKIAGLTEAEAKDMIIQSVQQAAEIEAQKYVNKIEQESKLLAEKKARAIVVSAIQRIAPDVTAEVAISTVSLPGEEMKGRIIGREGRNIRALETLTGVDIIIDDTPEAVVISCFDSVRREVAKIAIERLISDGRIHPARIEEIVDKVNNEIQDKIREEGERACFDLGISGMAPELQRYIGRLRFRTSYGQNNISHSKEVARLAALIAAEVGADVEISKRAGLLHDIGKGVSEEGDGGHATIGAEIARKLGEHAKIVNAIASHHYDVEPESLEAIIVQTADAISAGRPGARRETFENYIKRLENLEKIANSFYGVEKSFAIQAGRELRILVNQDNMVDDDAKKLAREIAKRIEDELKYPGQVKVTVIRETRVVEYAR